MSLTIFAGSVEVYPISGDGSSLRRVWLVSGLLFKGCKPVCRKSRNSRTAFHCRCCWPAHLETSNAAFHRRRNTVLYVAPAVCILNMQKCPNIPTMVTIFIVTVSFNLYLLCLFLTVNA